MAEAFALAQWRGPWMGWDALVAHAAKGRPALEPDFAPNSVLSDRSFLSDHALLDHTDLV